MKYKESNGDSTEYRFEDLRIDPELPQDRFRLELPPQVEVQKLRSGGVQ